MNQPRKSVITRFSIRAGQGHGELGLGKGSEQGLTLACSRRRARDKSDGALNDTDRPSRLMPGLGGQNFPKGCCMTKILFICQGNTCRSPMTEVIASRIFGLNHVVASTGIETASGSPAARHAIAVAKEMRLDLASHRTRSIESFDLAGFDILVPMDELVASTLHVPAGVRLEKFDICDPYGKPLDAYRTTARVIQRNIRRLYASDTLVRLTSTDPPQGSHALGVVVRAAKEFEKETASIVKFWCPSSKTDTLPLGKLAVVLKRNATKASPPKNQILLELAGIMEQVNKSWVQLKHRDDPPIPELVAATELVIKGFDHIAAIGPPN